MILLTLDYYPCAINFEGDAVAFILGDFIQAMAATHQMQVVQLFLLVVVQFLKDMVASTLAIDDSVPLLPTCHY
jgi:hypothetical protein